MSVFIILLEDDLVVFGFLVLVMDFLLIKLRKFYVNFLRVFNFFYLLIIYLVFYFLYVYFLILFFILDNFFMFVRIIIFLLVFLDLFF